MSFVANTSCTNDPWYLIHCKPKKELYAANALRTILQIPVLLPESQSRSRGGVRRVPFFTGYIFAQADLQKTSRSSINGCPGVVRLVEFGGGPQPVPQYVIENLSEQLANLSAVGPHKFHPGDAVRVKQGPLRDLEMMFVGTTTPGKRVCVLLKFLGRLKEIRVEEDMLEKIP